MKKALLNFIAWLYDDYKLVDKIEGGWRVHVSSEFGKYKENRNCTFEILYSKIADKYILRCHGYAPTEHYEHYNAIRLLNRYNTGQNFKYTWKGVEYINS